MYPKISSLRTLLTIPLKRRPELPISNEISNKLKINFNGNVCGLSIFYSILKDGCLSNSQLSDSQLSFKIFLYFFRKLQDESPFFEKDLKKIIDNYESVEKIFNIEIDKKNAPLNSSGKVVDLPTIFLKISIIMFCFTVILNIQNPKFGSN